MHSPHSLLPEHVVALPPSSPVFGFSPRIAVDRSNGNIFVAVGSSLLVYDACHTRLLSQRRVFSQGCISFLSHSHNSLVAATGSRLCLWTDVARAADAEPQIINCLSRVLVCAYSHTAAHPLVAVLHGGGCRGAGAAVHFSAGSDSRLIVAKTTDAPEWQSKTGGMSSCACIAVDDSDSDSGRFVCASGASNLHPWFRVIVFHAVLLFQALTWVMFAFGLLSTEAASTVALKFMLVRCVPSTCVVAKTARGYYAAAERIGAFALHFLRLLAPQVQLARVEANRLDRVLSSTAAYAAFT
jgi:hypothetical protein